MKARVGGYRPAWLPDANEVLFPRAGLQPCIVYLFPPAPGLWPPRTGHVIADLEPVYRAINAQAAGDALDAGRVDVGLAVTPSCRSDWIAPSHVLGARGTPITRGECDCLGKSSHSLIFRART